MMVGWNASAISLERPKTRLWDFAFASALSIRLDAPASPRPPREIFPARYDGAFGSPHAAEGGGALIAEEKFGYLFGEASGSAHNVERALQNASQLGRIGVHEGAEGRALLQAHFNEVVSSPSNILETFSNQHGNFQVRESLFAGPGGFVKFESTWQVLEGGQFRFTTAIPYGGP
jgi:filamentous hemagglutinin